MKKVLGLGNALVDILYKLPDDGLLGEYHFSKGSMNLVDRETMGKIMASAEPFKKKISSGGSAANTIHGLAHLGVETGFIGKVGKDEYGYVFENELSKNNIRPVLMKGVAETGKALTLISPDSERTFATYLGAAIELSESEIKEEIFEKYDIFHIEGYLVQNQKLTSTVLQMAKQRNLITSLDLASFNIVNTNRKFLEDIIAKYVDIVFANEEEAFALTGLESSMALFHLATLSKIAVVKLGAEGSLIKKAENYYRIKAYPANPVDTTGAGDAYAAGFLFGLVNELPLNKCGEIGALISARVVETIGAKLDRGEWDMLMPRINQIIKA